MKVLRQTVALLNHQADIRAICTCSVFWKRDKFSLKNIGGKVSSPGRRKAPTYNKFGGNKESPVTLYQLPSNKDDIFGRKTEESRHKSMIESSLHTSVESLIWSGEIDSRLSACPMEITGVDMTSNFSSATVFWRLDECSGSWTEDDVEKLLSENLDFIRRMLPAYHSMTHTPSVSFSKSNSTDKDKLLQGALKRLRKDKDRP